MAKKRILNRKFAQKEELQSLEQRVTAAQRALKEGAFESVLPLLVDIRQETAEKPEFERIYLTSFVWEIRALSALKKPKTELQRAVERYRDEAKACQDAARQAQAELMLAQACIDHEDFERAETHLELALDLAIKVDDDTQVFRALMGLARVQIAQLRFTEAVDILGRAKEALPDGKAGIEPQILEQRAYIESECVDIYEKLGDGQAAHEARERFLALAKNGFDSENLQVLETLYRIKTLDLEGKSRLMLASIDDFEQHIAKQNTADAVVQGYVARFERARAKWKCGDYTGACEDIEALLSPDLAASMPTALARAIELSKIQYRMEKISTMATITAELDAFKASLVADLPRTVAESILAADLCHASVYIYRGDFRSARERLESIIERSKFMRLGSVMTPAHASFARVELRAKRYGAGLAWVELAESGYERAQDRVNLLLIRALKWRLKLGLAIGEGDKALLRFAENYAGVQSEFEAELAYLEAEGSHEASLSLALALSQLADACGDKDKAIGFLEIAAKRLVDDYKPAAQITFWRLEGRLLDKPQSLEKALSLAQQTAYYEGDAPRG